MEMGKMKKKREGEQKRFELLCKLHDLADWCGSKGGSDGVFYEYLQAIQCVLEIYHVF